MHNQATYTMVTILSVYAQTFQTNEKKETIMSFCKTLHAAITSILEDAKLIIINDFSAPAERNDDMVAMVLAMWMIQRAFDVK